MTYASDKLYDEVIRRNLGLYTEKVKASEILPFLPCLTLTDKEEVEAKIISAGNSAAVQILLGNLRRRGNWPEQLIYALKHFEHTTLADQLRDAYDRIRGRTSKAAAALAQAPASDSTAAAAAAATTMVTTHTVPVTPPPILTPPSVNPPAQTTATSSIAAQVPPPASDQHVEQVPSQATSPEPASLPQIPPPVVVSSQTSVPVVPTSEVASSKVSNQGGATENETTLSDTPDGQTTPSFTDGKVLSSSSAPASSSIASLSHTTNSHSISQSSQNSEKDKVQIAVEVSSEKLPVQDNNFPLNMEPEKCSDQTVNEAVQRTNTAIRIPQPTPSAPAEVVIHCLPSVSQDYFSKPDVLRTYREEPCSTTTDDLEISRTSEPSAELGHSSSLEHSSEPLSSINESSDASSSQNLAQEDHYESLCESEAGILTSIIHFAEEGSVENLNGQTPKMLGNTLNSCGGSEILQHSKGISKDQPVQIYENTESGVCLRKLPGRDAIRPSDQERSTSINYQEQESNGAKQASSPNVGSREEGQTTRHINKLHLTAAAAAVSIGLFVVWKINH